MFNTKDRSALAENSLRLEQMVRDSAVIKLEEELKKALEPVKFLIRRYDYKQICQGDVEYLEKMLFNKLAVQYGDAKLQDLLLKHLKEPPNESA